ncbi:Uncharacterised protein [Mycoplasma putrefaciens]|nr:Uncharacterised protein [Mycoplasma putrefaciens]
MNLDENELKKIINSDDIINANGRLDNLCNGKFTQQVKQVLSDKFNTPLFKVKPFKFRNYVQEFIQEQRIKAKKIK